VDRLRQLRALGNSPPTQNHIDCEKKFRDKNIHDLRDKNLLYECLVCAQKSKANSDKNKKPDKEEEKPKLKVEINRDQRTLIFHKKNENFPNLEYFLQNYSTPLPTQASASG
jgi:hypothetical protein